MKLSHVFESVEAAMTKLGILDVFGQPCTGLEAFGLINAANPDAWTTLESGLERGEISTEQYRSGALDLIQQVARDRFRSTLEKRLVKLQADQKEMQIQTTSPDRQPVPGDLQTQGKLFL